jgi:hypothetical protein
MNVSVHNLLSINISDDHWSSMNMPSIITKAHIRTAMDYVGRNIRNWHDEFTIQYANDNLGSSLSYNLKTNNGKLIMECSMDLPNTTSNISSGVIAFTQVGNPSL